MAIDLKLIKRKWKIILILWFGLLVVVNVLNIVLFSLDPPILNAAGGEKNLVQAKGNFSPGGDIKFYMSPVYSINGWHDSKFLVKPIFSKSQEKKGLNRILRGLEGQFSDGVFGYDDIPGYKLKTGIERQVNLQMDFYLPDNIKIVGETVVFEVESKVKFPRRIGKDKYSVSNKTFIDRVRIRFNESSGENNSSFPETLLPIFIILWFIGLIVIYSKIKKDPY